MPKILPVVLVSQTYPGRLKIFSGWLWRCDSM